MNKGKITRLLQDKGFIKPADNSRDVSFFISVVKDSALIKEGVNVEYEAKMGDRGPYATKVTVVEERLAKECIYATFYENGNLSIDIFMKSAEKAALCFRESGFKSSQFRGILQALMQIGSAINSKRCSFEQGRVRFGAFYAEKIVRQYERKHLTKPVKDFFDAHKDVALSSKEEFLGLVTYFKNIYCYFGESD